MSRNFSNRSIGALLAVGVLALLLAACATPAPPLSLPPVRDVARIEIDPGCSRAGCAPIGVVRNVYEIAFKLALVEALNDRWKQADPGACPSGRARGRTAFFDESGRLIMTVWERATSSTVRLAYEDPVTGCQVTRWKSLREYAQAIETAKRRYRQLNLEKPTGPVPE